MRINDFQLTEHFKLCEFQCPCCHTVLADPLFVKRLEALRVRWGAPLVINSGYRCAPHNAEVGGVPGSLHRLGRAADVRAREAEQPALAALASELGFTKAIRYGRRGFIHLETG